MGNIPKRRKYKDNPYNLIIENNKYFIQFKDSKKTIQTIEVDKSIYTVFNDSELHDLSELNEYDRHIEHSEVFDITLYKRNADNYYSLEKEVESSILREELKEAIDNLPDIQKRRLKKYYFEDKTYEQIASEENCTKSAVKFSIDIAIEKISKNFKN